MVIVGRTKIPYDDLFICSQKEIDAIIKGHEIDRNDQLEIIRLQTSKLLMVHVAEKDMPKIQPKNLWDYPWDKQEVKEPISTKETQQKFKNIRQLMKDGKIKPKSNVKSKHTS